MGATARAKTAQYYLGLRYPIRLRELSEEEGGGWVATIPQLGVRTFVAVEETPEEALAALDALRQHLIPILVAEGEELPEPEDEKLDLEQYSGNLLLRLPRELHAQIAVGAKRSGCSMNKYATQLLSRGLERSRLTEEIRSLRDEMRSLIAGVSHEHVAVRQEAPAAALRVQRAIPKEASLEAWVVPDPLKGAYAGAS